MRLNAKVRAETLVRFVSVIHSTRSGLERARRPSGKRRVISPKPSTPRGHPLIRWTVGQAGLFGDLAQGLLSQDGTRLDELFACEARLAPEVRAFSTFFGRSIPACCACLGGQPGPEMSRLALWGS